MDRPYRLLTAAPADADAQAHLLLHVVHDGTIDDRPQGAIVRSGLPVLDGPAEEWWLSPDPVRRFEHAGAALRGNRDIAMGCVYLDEDRLRADPAAAAQGAFAALLEAIKANGYPWLLRTWIYLADIHRGADDAERYRQFCVGRARVLAEHTSGPMEFPAATAIGRPSGGGGSIHFLAATTAGEAIENPRQTSAFDYPRRYGPQPPSFVRAMRTPWRDLLVSGTASVVGHDSRFPGDAQAQAATTRDNVQALLAQSPADWQAERTIIYVREPKDLAAVKALRPASGACTVLQGDICRPDLMLECEVLLRG
ncbi:pteridine-dependent deoxygenase [Algiphilus sp.]|uniref:chorismate transformation enzyme, FkbO/Hyg5 family n=1 Tax=Algiphilus sp. TaxID=1872431 RepID=UPI003B525A38